MCLGLFVSSAKFNQKLIDELKICCFNAAVHKVEISYPKNCHHYLIFITIAKPQAPSTCHTTHAHPTHHNSIQIHRKIIA